MQPGRINQVRRRRNQRILSGGQRRQNSPRQIQLGQNQFRQQVQQIQQTQPRRLQNTNTPYAPIDNVDTLRRIANLPRQTPPDDSVNMFFNGFSF